MLENGFVVHVDTKDDGWPCSFLLSATMGELLSKAMIYDVRHLAIILHGIDKVELAERKPPTLGGLSEELRPEIPVRYG
jgi:hypothetical protein